MSRMRRFSSTPFGMLLMVAAAVPSSAMAGQARDSLATTHMRFIFEPELEPKVRAFLPAAEEAFTFVDSLFEGALPDTIRVHVLRDGGSRATWDSVLLSMQVPDQAQQIFAHELAHMAHRALAGQPYEEQRYWVINEGVGAWVEEYFEERLGEVEPRALRAAYAGHLGKATLNDIEKFNELSNALDPGVVYALGWSWVTRFVERHGRAALLRLLRALRTADGLCEGLVTLGIDCADEFEAWRRHLAGEAVRLGVAGLPQLTTHMRADPEGDSIRVSIRVIAKNLAQQPYNTVDISFQVEGRHASHRIRFASTAGDTVAAIGTFPRGSEFMWDAVTFSPAMGVWVKSGWQSRRLRQ